MERLKNTAQSLVMVTFAVADLLQHAFLSPSISCAILTMALSDAGVVKIILSRISMEVIVLREFAGWKDWLGYTGGTANAGMGMLADYRVNRRFRQVRRVASG
jgi:hypothetical protein